jgi:hypothetical protein
MTAHHTTTIGQARPLTRLGAGACASPLRRSGFWSPEASTRTGIDSLTVRQDVSVLDALESARQFQQQAIAVLSLLEADLDAGAVLNQVASAAAGLLRLAAGHVQVVLDEVGRLETDAAGADTGGEL